jgi:hypothetical protein
MHLLQTVHFRVRQYCEPLTKLIEKQAFQWTPEMEAAFQSPKDALCTAPILVYSQPRERFVVGTDASNVGIGGVLSQDGQVPTTVRR